MQRLECAVLEGGSQATWAQEWLSERRELREVCLQPLALSLVGSTPSVTALQQAQPHLYRFQVCVLPVDAQNLSWARTALANVDRFTVPHLGVSHQLRAEALGDLLQLGMTDFVSCDADVHELRARSLQAIRRLGVRQGSWVAKCDDARRADGLQVAEPHAQYVASVEAHDAYDIYDANHARDARDAGIEQDIAALNFKLAKQRLIEKFEVTFLHRSLKRHRGNVTRAAFECDKHRRAFWALMQKHHINARAFRTDQI